MQSQRIETWTKWFLAALFAAGALTLSACGDNTPSDICRLDPALCEAPWAGLKISAPHWVVPTELPGDITAGPANNNLDVALFGGRLYLAFRTGLTHFASEDVRVHVISTDDHRTWRKETELFFARDLREPRFLNQGDTLLLYVTQLGTNPTSFDVGDTMLTETTGDGAWSTPTRVRDDGTLIWRTQTDGLRQLVTAHRGWRNNTGSDAGAVDAVLWQTDDGRSFAPVGISEVVFPEGVSEFDIAKHPAGGWVAVGRNEQGITGRGFGSVICSMATLEQRPWTCDVSPKKYDSPRLFTAFDQVFLIARRNVTTTGNYDLGNGQDISRAQATANDVDYWSRPKACSLWRVRADRTIDYLADLPSAGDTCFASIVPVTDRRVLAYNYTSDIVRPDLPWLTGQTNPTYIYWATIDLPPLDEAHPIPDPIFATPEGASSIRCGEATCFSGGVGLGGATYYVDPCCANGGSCGLVTTERVIDAFDVTPASLLSLQTLCLPLFAAGTECAGGVCACPDSTLTVVDPSNAESTYVVPMRGCCRGIVGDADRTCGYDVDIANAEPEIPIALEIEPGCMDPEALLETAQGPAGMTIACDAM